MKEKKLNISEEQLLKVNLVKEIVSLQFKMEELIETLDDMQERSIMGEA